MRMRLFNNSNYYFLTIFALILLLSACTPQRNLVYMSDLGDSTNVTEAILNQVDTKIKEGDILSITVNTLSPESNALFNKGEMLAPSATNTQAVVSQSSGATALSNVGYLVDKDGNINFPVIGTVGLEGLTLEQARQKLTAEISKQTKSPIVNIRFMNFKVTVIGEVTQPGTFTLTNDKVNVLEAIGLAGDMTPYGKRENVMLIRENNGQRTIARLNMNKKDVTQSPYFYLQQNDVVYIEPDNEQKTAQADVRSTRTIPIVTALISAAAVLVSVLVR